MFERFAILAEPAVIDHRCGNCGFTRARKSGCIRQVGKDERNFRRIIFGLRGLD
jgi:hypothetical protein